MEKVAIVSCYFQKNYGSMLQSFATQKIVNMLGYEHETICIDGIYKELQKAKIKHYLLQLNNFDVVKGKLGFIKKSIVKKINKELTRQMAIRDEKFLEFKNTRFKLSRTCKSRQELTDYCKDFSSVLVGSDQLWLPSNIDSDYYTLSFVPDKVNKVSYATSFGVSNIPERQWEKANEFLNRINHVSVREEAGQQIVKEIANREVKVVCDPTFLLTADQWAEEFPSKRIIKEKYIFCYFLGNNPEQRDFVRKAKEITGFKIVALLHLDEYVKSDCNFPDYAPFDIGPAEFFNLIRQAEYVFTDSFHGTVFSVLNQKKFFTYRRFKEGSSLSTNSRMHSLFNVLDLHERFITVEQDVNECLMKEIDYKTVLEKLDSFRKESINYLIRALETEKNRE
ncbi:polysaccharide pyruvyl transferase family protein [Desulfosporosinus nitroreducens]|uniref:polysaccharide pyruvyl transferase family protein n=1 Tax=Desulfosporosinus nitroreducens TaxID=2018668 RepID=UPI00207CD9FF|nr:polysaccharide pyruvyl transferase family protein [Desulfosporosinus nitroreducens]MCO1600975.1 polysaccharide pyruvyl transferase family protein [Desulfosporosinus nitroreducens]